MTYQRESTNHSFMMKKLSMDLVNLYVLESAKKVLSDYYRRRQIRCDS